MGKIKNNKILNIIGNIIYTVTFIIILLMLIVVVLQRISNNNIALGGFRIFSVVTGSMVPKYQVGDILISKEIDAKELKKGDDIVYQGKEGSFQGKVITHQIIDIEQGEDKIITKGIANDIEDPQISKEQVLGKVIYKIRILSFLGKMVQNIYVFYFVIFVPIVILIFKQIFTLITSKEEKDKDEKIDNNKKD